MPELFLPDQKDIEGVISDYLTTIVPGKKSHEERKRIIENCTKPISILINAWELAASFGETEKLIWVAVMQDIAISRQQKRTNHFVEATSQFTSNHVRSSHK